MIEIRLATATEETIVHDLLYSTALWLKSIGSKQWNGFLEGKDNHNTLAAIERNEVFLCFVNNQVAGMFILWDEQSKWDQELWGVTSSKDSYYLHRLNVSRAYAGQGIANGMLKWAILNTKREGKKQLRLDCLAENMHLNEFYQKAGFQLVGQKRNHNAGEQIADFNLYQISAENNYEQ